MGDYSKPSHEGYRNTIELPVGKNVVPLQSDAIQLVQNECSFHGLRFEDPNQHLKDFLKLVDSLDLDGENRERTRLRLFQFFFRDQASNWLERLLAGSITTWEDLTTRFLTQFFPPRRTTKLHNDIMIRTIDQSAEGKLCDLNAKESWALLEDLALYDNESWNDPRDFTKLVKEIALPQDVPMNKITTSCEIYSGSHDTQYCMEDPEQAFIEYASSHTDEAGGEMTNKIDTVLKAITHRISGALPSDTVKNLKLNTYPVLSARSYPTVDPQCSSHPSNSINAIKAHFKEATISQTSMRPPKIETKPPQPEEPEPTLEDEF
ncbi:MAK10-like protein [Tanacetum coccineum]